MNLPALCSEIFPRFLIFSNNVSPVVYYAHIPVIIISIFLGFFVLLKGKKSLTNNFLFFTLIFAILWIILSLIFWASNRSDIIMFVWAITILIEPLVYICSFYLIYLLAYKKDVPFKLKLIIGFLYLPVIIFSPTNYSLSGFDLASCLSIEGFLGYYDYIIEFIFTFWLLVLAIIKYRQSTEVLFKKQIKYITTGIFLFLFAFSWGNIISSFTENWQISLVGLFALPIFIGFLVYSIVQFKTFNIKLLGAQALVMTLGILIAAQFIFIKVTINIVLTGITLTLAVIFGYFLIRSVKKEIQQKEELVKLNIDLQDLIKQRESLVHLVTHKVKGSFTRSKYIFAGILDGSFGETTLEMKKYAKQGLESDNLGIETVDLVLNADNLQKGTVKYDMQKINFKEIIQKATEEKRGRIESNGLKLEIDIKNDTYSILGDAFWLKEAVNNLIENSIKYTKEGKIKIGLEDGNGKILFSIKDTGIGITPEDKNILFTEGGRGKDSVKMNVDSTGYGLYSVKLIIEAHKGKVWVESEGAGKGSAFYIELDSES